jgi:hypothetical protein
MAMNITSFALPGICRTRMTPAVISQRPSRAAHRLLASDDAPLGEISAEEGNGVLAQGQALLMQWRGRWT